MLEVRVTMLGFGVNEVGGIVLASAPLEETSGFCENDLSDFRDPLSHEPACILGHLAHKEDLDFLVKVEAICRYELRVRVLQDIRSVNDESEALSEEADSSVIALHLEPSFLVLNGEALEVV